MILILGKTEGRKRRGRQRMRWLNSTTNSVDMNLNKFQEIVKDRGTWRDAVHGVVIKNINKKFSQLVQDTVLIRIHECWIPISCKDMRNVQEHNTFPKQLRWWHQHEIIFLKIHLPPKTLNWKLSFQYEFFIYGITLNCGVRVTEFISATHNE